MTVRFGSSEHAAKIITGLYDLYPQAVCTLSCTEPWKLLVSGILAAQCTDARVNIVTPFLFTKYPTVHALSQADLPDIEDIIRSCGFFRVKAKSIKESMLMIEEEYSGKIPNSIEDLIKLPGIGRKIANLVLGDCFGVPAIVVDTHCARISHHLGLTESFNPAIIERDLAAILPVDSWIDYGHMIVAHGRTLCKAKSPMCRQCPLSSVCRHGREQLNEDG